MADPTKVRVGDRYLRGDDEHITVIAINASENKADYLAMRPGRGKPAWHATIELPLPDSWVKTGSGPLPRSELCLNCQTDEREAGQFFCADCMDATTANWAGLTPEQITDRIEALKLIADDPHEQEESHG